MNFLSMQFSMSNGSKSCITVVTLPIRTIHRFFYKSRCLFFTKKFLEFCLLKFARGVIII